MEFLREISEADPAAKIARPIKSLADGMTVAADDETVGFKEVRVTLLEGATALIRGL